MKEGHNREAESDGVVLSGKVIAASRQQLLRQSNLYRGLSVFSALAAVYVGFETLPQLLEHLQHRLSEEGLSALNSRALVAAALPAALGAFSIMSLKSADQRLKEAREKV